MSGEDKIRQLLSEATHLNQKVRKGSLPKLEEALQMAETLRDEYLIAYVNTKIAFYKALFDNEYAIALTIASTAYNSLKIRDKVKLAHLYNYVSGYCHHHTNNTVKANDHYIEALKQLIDAPEDDLYKKRIEAQVNYNLFLLCNYSNKNAVLQEYYNKAFELYTELNDTEGISACYNAMARIAYNNTDYAESLRYMKEALKLNETTNELSSKGAYESNIALVYATMGNREQWQHYMDLAYKTLTELNTPVNLLVFYHQKGTALLGFGEVDSAIECYKKSLEMAEKIGDEYDVTIQHNYLSEAYAKKGDYEKAFYHGNLYSRKLQESIDNQKDFAAAKARSLFEFEQKEKENKLLLEKQEQIERYVKKLEYSNEDLQRFAHVASHDLREPVRMVSSYIQLLEKSMEGKMTDTDREYINFVKDGAHRMDGLIRDLLEYSKVTKEINYSPVDLNSVIEKVKQNIQELVKERNAKIICADLPVVNADETLMTQLFQNLISNGIKYNTSNQPSVAISCINSNSHFRFKVSDNGIGIPEQFRSKVFEIFQRLHSRHEYSGSGIGLSICKRIIEHFGGEINVEENTSGGSDFIFTIAH